ncbi:hypothetical protein [Aeromicrobium sp. CTD01-1L150]|uniref:hypothetical protein n=1 Tax=Aeromicrobium sp. CTD01-1L150 TaxID=3341830 RepID=UPI0035BECDB2
MVLRSILVSVAEAVILALLVIDRVLEPTWNGGVLTAAKIVVVATAIVAAALPYQSWSTLEPRSNLLTVAMASGLVGGAALTASVFGSVDGVLFGSLPLALLGLVGVVAAAVSLRLDARIRKDAAQDG